MMNSTAQTLVPLKTSAAKETGEAGTKAIGVAPQTPTKTPKSAAWPLPLDGLTKWRARMPFLWRMTYGAMPETGLTPNPLPQDVWPGSAENGRSLLDGKFSYFGSAREGDMALWAKDLPNPEWSMWFHSLGWLRDLRMLGGDKARRQARILTREWLDLFETPDPEAWHPAPLGDRLANLLGLYDFFLASAEEGYRRDVMLALVKQARFGYHSLETWQDGPYATHLLRGLLMVALLMPSEQDKVDVILSAILEHIPMALNADGGHKTRNPNHHLTVLKHLLDCRNILQAHRMTVPVDLTQAIKSMIGAYSLMRHGDDQLCNFNGGRHHDPAMLDMIQHYCRALPRVQLRHLPQTGYQRMSLGRSVLILDRGDVPPPEMAGWVHASPMAFEFSHGRERLIISCGDRGIAPMALNTPIDTQKKRRGRQKNIVDLQENSSQTPLSPELAYRTTAAHSTISINDTSTMRFAANGLPYGGARNLSCARSQDEDGGRLTCSHDGYGANFGLFCERQIMLSNHGDDLHGEECLKGESDHTVTIRFHLDPDVTCSLTSENEKALLKTKSGMGWQFACENAKLSLEPSIYAADPTRTPRPTEQLVLTTTTQGETRIRWSLKRLKKP